MRNRITVYPNLRSKISHIEVSPQQMGQVLINLINNAMEAMNPAFTMPDNSENPPEGGKITIITRQRDDHIIMEVSDNGPGIADDALENLFMPFYTSKKEYGTGMGLSICRDIIEEHQGAISARNAPDGGAIFSIRLPLPAMIA